MRLPFIPFTLLLFFPLVAAAQQLHIGIGPGFSIIRPPEMYDASMVDAMGFAWPKEVRVVVGQAPDKGYSGIARVRFKLPRLPLSLIGGLAYTRIVGESDQVHATAPPWSSLMVESGRLETKADVLGISAGLRWDILRAPVAPYLSAAVAYNRFGEMTLTITAEQWQSKATIDAVRRTGLAFAAGVAVALRPTVQADIELGYAMLNAFGRESGEDLHDAASVSLVFSFRVL